MTLHITAIEEVLELPAFLPTPQRKRARTALAQASALLRNLDSPAGSSGDTRPRPVDVSPAPGGADL